MTNHPELFEWKATASFVGGAALSGQSYPVVLETAETGERLECRLSEPRDEGPRFPRLDKTLRQDAELVVFATKERVEEFASGFVHDIAACIAFASGAPVSATLGVMRTTASEVTGGAGYVDVVPVPIRADGVSVHSIDASIVGIVLHAIGDSTSERGRWLFRSMRWLCRAVEAHDQVEQFVFLAFGLEAIASLLPKPPPSGKKRDGPSDTKTHRISHFATTVDGVTKAQWVVVGKLRHELVHGGLTDDLDSRARLSAVIPVTRKVLKAALRAIMNLPDGIPPYSVLDDVGIGRISVSFHPKPPESQPDTPPA